MNKFIKISIIAALCLVGMYACTKMTKSGPTRKAVIAPNYSNSNPVAIEGGGSSTGNCDMCDIYYAPAGFMCANAFQLPDWMPRSLNDVCLERSALVEALNDGPDLNTPGSKCLIKYVNNLLPTTTTNPDTIQTVYPYLVRDSFMSKFSRGWQYEVWYSVISISFFRNNAITLSNVADARDFANEFINVTHNITNGSWSGVPVDSTFKSHASWWISYARSKDTDAGYNRMLDTIQSDINWCLGKTRTQIYAHY